MASGVTCLPVRAPAAQPHLPAASKSPGRYLAGRAAIGSANAVIHPFILPRFLLSLWLLVAGALLSAVLLACGPGSNSADQKPGGAAVSAVDSVVAGPQPLLDSTYVIRQLRAEPLFKVQEGPARRFYRERSFRLGWFRNHKLLPQAQTLLDLLPKAADEGLDPKKYQVKDFAKLASALQAAGSDTARRNAVERETDVALTGTYLLWASDYYRGVANPHDVKDTSWQVKPNKIKLHKALLTFLGERKSRYNYYEFAPLHPEYEGLKEALASYRAQEQAGGWPLLPAALKLRPGQSAAAVPALRQRLAGGAAPRADTSAAALAYDTALVRKVKIFQQDAGLRPDGIVSGTTLRQLNVPIAARIDQLILNMERWRWLPKKFEPDYLLVNIPEYKLHVVEGGKEAFAMRVIVGKTLNATPIFSDRMEYVVLAPYWNVPYSIIDKEMRPRLVANPSYLDRLDMEVVSGSGRKAKVIDPSGINWADVTEANFKYTVRRRPGPKNDLGDVKFIFPNANDVYLHDTPHDELFSETQRNFSHGCVRVQEPIKLATYLLREKSGWSQSAIVDTIANRREKYISLKQKLPVYLVYFTAWADANGHAHFREDIYGHDKALAKEYFN